ncbi:MAG TPA: LD-carboxypeptidase [Gemmatimonadales bacterium]|nr:LD-carboxypeptidase [Gemmatimonadales bacterium]
MTSTSSIRPPRLGPGARVALVAPAGPLLERDDLARGEALVRALGWEPVLAPHAGGHHGYLSGTDEERLGDLNAALADPRVDAVWCLRGGYGMTRILPGLDFAAARRRPKVVLGFSDITALLVPLFAETGLVTFHGPIARTEMGPFARYHLDRVVTNVNAPGRLGRLAPPADTLVPQKDRIATLVPGVAEGPLVGGNLTLLQCLIGTRWFPDLRGAILFIEDVGEDVYSIDRMLSHLALAGKLAGLAGVLVGRFTELKKGGEDGAMGVDQVLARYLAPLRVPVACGFPVGHIDEQWTLPIGVRARLDATAGELDLLEAAVS